MMKSNFEFKRFQRHFRNDVIQMMEDTKINKKTQSK